MHLHIKIMGNKVPTLFLIPILHAYTTRKTLNPRDFNQNNAEPLKKKKPIELYETSNSHAAPPAPTIVFHLGRRGGGGGGGI